MADSVMAKIESELSHIEQVKEWLSRQSIIATPKHKSVAFTRDEYVKLVGMVTLMQAAGVFSQLESFIGSNHRKKDPTLLYDKRLIILAELKRRRKKGDVFARDMANTIKSLSDEEFREIVE